MSEPNVYFNVVPRYTPGSPAIVPEDIANDVAIEESAAYERALNGVNGADAQARAERLGLRGISEQRTEHAECWVIKDLITLERFVRPFKKEYRDGSARSNAEWKLAQTYRAPLERTLPGALAAVKAS
jgi:hypothetical protein